MKINSGNSTIHLPVEPQNSRAKWEEPDLNASKNIPEDLGASQTLAKDAKGELNMSGVVRRSAIDQDLNQSDNCIKQQILEYPSGNR